jgi:small-conductance mechanosensitive channel
VTFHYKTEASGPMQYGLIAEEVAHVYPELVTRDEAGAIDGVRYEALTPLLLKEVQGQHRQITAQAQQLATQAQKLTTQDQQLAELKAQNARLAAALVQQNTALAARLEQLEQGARGMTTVSTR